MALRVFAVPYSHHQHFLPEWLLTSSGQPIPVQESLPVPPSSQPLDNYGSAFCVCALAHSGCFIHMESYHVGPLVSDFFH